MKIPRLAWLLTVLALASPLPLAAKSNPLLSGSEKKRDQRTPIEVSADALEVLQEENKAIFSGHVVAVQGDLRLTAESMTVYYNPNAKSEQGKKEKSENNAIKKIDALGGVFLATPEETASGTHGVYDVENEEIRLTGKVVLTRGKNTLEGESLVYNFATGKSKLTSAATATGADKAKTEKGQRVRAVFIPEESSKPK